MEISFYIGLIGMVLILAGFTLELLKKLSKDHIIYCLLNAFGSLAMSYYAYILNSIPFLILNVVWVLVSIYGISTDLKKRYSS